METTAWMVRLKGKECTAPAIACDVLWVLRRKPWESTFAFDARSAQRVALQTRFFAIPRWAVGSSQFARVVKGVDLRSTAGNCAWVRTPQLTFAFVARAVRRSEAAHVQAKRCKQKAPSAGAPKLVFRF